MHALRILSLLDGFPIRRASARQGQETKTMTTTTYGICYGEGASTTVIECESLDSARDMAAQTAAKLEQDVDVVELEGAGPVYADDGARIAEAHAPKRTLATIGPDVAKAE
jgi:hypothetical protein